MAQSTQLVDMSRDGARVLPVSSPGAVLLAGSANPPLAASVERELHIRFGACRVERFPDGEVSVRLDQGVRGQEVVLLQGTSPPVNDHLVELLAHRLELRRRRLRPRLSDEPGRQRVPPRSALLTCA